MTAIATATDAPRWRSPTGRCVLVTRASLNLTRGVAAIRIPTLLPVSSPTSAFRAMRPRQWVKNLLVLAAPLAAGEVLTGDVARATLVAFVAFCLASSAVYLVNDIADRGSDRLHPMKRNRPIAAGDLSVSTAMSLAATLVVGGLALAFADRWQLGVLLASYLALQAAYSCRLKHEPVLDLAVVTAGFVMRAVAGGLAAGLEISDWFLLVTGFGALFVVAGKRYSELHVLGHDAGTRRSLVRYTSSYLRFVWSIAASVTLVGYSLWAFERGADSGTPWAAISIFPFAVAMLRYAVDIDAGMAAEPEEIIWVDHGLQLVGAVWLVLVCVGIASG
jgi:decaprenyl-phosphate phosphoribosyltransferase